MLVGLIAHPPGVSLTFSPMSISGHIHCSATLASPGIFGGRAAKYTFLDGYFVLSF